MNSIATLSLKHTMYIDYFLMHDSEYGRNSYSKCGFPRYRTALCMQEIRCELYSSKADHVTCTTPCLHVLYVHIANYMQAVPKYTHNYIIYKFKCSPVSIIIMGISKSCSTLLLFRLIILVITVEL